MEGVICEHGETASVVICAGKYTVLRQLKVPSSLGVSETDESARSPEGSETLDEFLHQFPSVTREQAIPALDLARESLLASARAS